MPNAYVFPGGVVAEADTSGGWLEVRALAAVVVSQVSPTAAGVQRAGGHQGRPGGAGAGPWQGGQAAAYEGRGQRGRGQGHWTEVRRVRMVKQDSD